MSLYLFDDGPARTWRPFRLTRPVGELLYGCLLLRERAERHWKRTCRGHLAGEALLGFDPPDAPPAIRPEDVTADADRLVLASRWVPDEDSTPEVGGADQGPATLTVDGEPVGWYLPAGTPTPDDDLLVEPTDEPAPDRSVEIGGVLLEHPWDLVTGNGDRIRADVPDLFPHSHAFLPPEAERIGDDHPISVGDDVELEPGVVFDTRHGPVRLDDRVTIRANTRVEGPAFVGRDTVLLGGSIAGVSIGPVCKIHGEVEASVILGFANKAHAGYLGHAYLGRWVNLGAMTTNSDLKNNYGPVRLRMPEGEVETGLLKLGCMLGDHAKTGIGTLLDTGTVVGAGSNLFGTEMPPKYVPPFSWGTGDRLGEYRLDAFLETAARVMARRDRELDDGGRSLLERAWRSSRPEREA